MVICTWKRRRGASVASTLTLTAFWPHRETQNKGRRESAESRISFNSINARARPRVCRYRRAMRICLLAAMLAATAAAQGLTDPPTIVQFVRKPGTGGASLKPYANTGAAVTVIGMAAVTGLP